MLALEKRNSLSRERERERENKIDLYRSSGLRQLQRFDAIQAETPFLLLSHEEDRRRLCTLGAFILIQNSLIDNEEDTVYQTISSGSTKRNGSVI